MQNLEGAIQVQGAPRVLLVYLAETRTREPFLTRTSVSNTLSFRLHLFFFASVWLAQSFNLRGASNRCSEGIPILLGLQLVALAMQERIVAFRPLLCFL
jgi:hypothetical protein